jgi:tripartite ATP-independent transporter DctM subunit
MITLILFLFLLLLGLPVVWVLMASVVVFLANTDLTVLYATVPMKFYGSIEKNGLLAIPLFMLVGEVMNRAGLTQKITNAANVLVGSLRGGLAYVNLLANAMAASILGSAIAQISVMSKTMIPQMHKRGYSKGLAAAVTTSGGLLGPIIPPSMLMIIYGVVAYQPIGALFVAGIGPGVLIFGALSLVIAVLGFFVDLPKENRLSKEEATKHLLAGMLPGIIPVVVIVGIVSGAMTPTESGAVASLVAIVLGVLVYKTIHLRDVPEIFESVALSTAVITCLIAAASTFGWVLAFDGVPDRLVDAIIGTTNSPLLFLLMVNIIILVLGMFLESISVMIVLVPILLPAVESMNIDLIHFGVIVSIGTVLGLISPPVGPGLYVAMMEAEVSLKELLKWITPFIVAVLISMIFINVFPSISIYLPKVLGLL